MKVFLIKIKLKDFTQSNCEVELISENQELKIYENEKIAVYGFSQSKINDEFWEKFSVYRQERLNSLDYGFTFIILNKKLKTIELARDFFGIKPLFYTISNDELICSNSLRKICDNSQKTINKDEIKSFFDPNYDDYPITKNTFFKDIFRVLPGHILNISSKTETSFVTFNLKSNENFGNILENEILNLNNDYISIGSHLSGGLDSSTIVSFLDPNKLNTYYFDDGFNTEKAIADKFAKEKNINHKTISLVSNSIENAKEIIKITYVPELLSIPSNIFLEICKQANENKNDVLFSGHGGDSIVDYGINYLTELYQNRDFTNLQQALNDYYEIRKRDSTFKTVTIDIFILDFLFKKNKSLILKIYLTIKDAVLEFKISKSIILSYLLKKLINKFKQKSISISPVFSGIKKEKTFTKIIKFEGNKHQENQINAHNMKLGVNALEVFDAIHCYKSLEPLYPFLNKKLLEISLNTPLVEKFHNGKGRGILRNSMRGKLPDYILERTDKAAFNDLFERNFLDLQGKYLINENHKLWTILDKKIYYSSLSIVLDPNFASKQKYQHLWFCSRALSVAIWLDTLDLL